MSVFFEIGREYGSLALGMMVWKRRRGRTRRTGCALCIYNMEWRVYLMNTFVPPMM